MLGYSAYHEEFANLDNLDTDSLAQESRVFLDQHLRAVRPTVVIVRAVYTCS